MVTKKAGCSFGVAQRKPASFYALLTAKTGIISCEKCIGEVDLFYLLTLHARTFNDQLFYQINM